MRTAKDILKTASFGSPRPGDSKIPTEAPSPEPLPTTPGGVGKGTMNESKQTKPVPMTSWQRMGLSKIPKP